MSRLTRGAHWLRTLDNARREGIPVEETICRVCGAVVAVAKVHTEWHIKHGDLSEYRRPRSDDKFDMQISGVEVDE